MADQTDRIVTGYHGTSTVGAAKILHCGEFAKSANEWDWLGHGIYFWEGPGRAWEWADDQFGHQAAAVVQASIRLGRCFDLTDSRFVPMVKIAYENFKSTLELAGKSLPVNARGNRRLDCLLFNYLVENVWPADTIRGVFLEGDPIYPGTEMRTRQHIQINVRNPACISHPEPMPR